MPKGCSVCQRDDVEQINFDRENGMTLQNIIAKYGGSLGAYHRHFQHLDTQLSRIDIGDNLTVIDGKLQVGEAMRKIQIIERRADELFKMAKKNDDSKTALNALKAHTTVLELYSKLTGELSKFQNQNQTVTHQHIHISPEWLELRSVMLKALQGYPEAKESVLRALQTFSERHED